MRLVNVIGFLVFLLLAGVMVFWISGIGANAVVNSSDDVMNAEGEYLENPFSRSSGGTVPKLESSEKEFDFGLMKFPLRDRDGDGEPDGDSHTFVIRNVGEGVLKLAKGPSTCQCTMAALEGEVVEVPPGGSTEVTVTWEPAYADESFSKSASIWTNDPALFEDGSESSNGKITFTVKGKVMETVRVEPSAFSLGTLGEKAPTPFTAFVYSQADKDFQVTVKESSSEFVTADIHPATPEELQELSAVAGFRIDGKIEPKLPVGRVTEKLTLSTSDDVRSELEISINAMRQGPISIAGRFWNNAEQYIDFQRFPAEKGIETTLYLYAAKQEPPFEIKLAEVQPAGLEVTAELDSEYAEPERERYLIKVKVPAGRAPERLYSKDAGFVRFETNNADVPAIKFHVIYESN